MNTTSTTTGTSTAQLVQEGEMAGNLVASILGAGKLSVVTDVARASVKAAVASLENGVDHLRASIDAEIEANPIFKQAIPAGRQILATLGVVLPTEDQLTTETKQAIADLGAAVTPPASA